MVGGLSKRMGNSDLKYPWSSRLGVEQEANYLLLEKTTGYRNYGQRNEKFR